MTRRTPPSGQVVMPRRVFARALGLGTVGALLPGCSWDFDLLVTHTLTDDRVAESLSGALGRPAPPPVDPEEFTFAAFGDPQIMRDGEHRLARLAADVGPLGIDFFIVVGDLTNDATEEEAIAIRAALDDVGVPYYVCPGNHDLLERDGWARFKRYFGPSVYSLGVGRHLRLIMTDNAHGTFGETQLDFIERELARPEPLKIVGGHVPIFDSVAPDFWCLASTAERYRVQHTLKAGGAFAYVSGHLHAFKHAEVEGVHHFVTGSMYPKTLNSGDPAYLLVNVRRGVPSWRRVDV